MAATQSQRYSLPPTSKPVFLATSMRRTAAKHSSLRDQPRLRDIPRLSALLWPPLPSSEALPILNVDSSPVTPTPGQAADAPPSEMGQPLSAAGTWDSQRLRQPLPPLPPPTPLTPLPPLTPLAPLPPPRSSHHSSHNRYLDMLLRLDKIPRLHNILATFFNWILLAGFIFFSGAFTIYDSPQFAAFLSVALVLSYTGLLGMVWLSIRWRSNYVWLLNKIYLPGALNGLAGLLTSIVSIYTQQSRRWSPCAKAVVSMEALLTVICALMFVLYNNLLLQRLKRRHKSGRVLKTSHCRWFRKVERAARERPFAPGSVV